MGLFVRGKSSYFETFTHAHGTLLHLGIRTFFACEYKIGGSVEVNNQHEDNSVVP